MTAPKRQKGERKAREIWCPLCGPRAVSDEDGTCRNCGATLISDEVLAEIRRLPPARARGKK
jgi:hypothetical protein